MNAKPVIIGLVILILLGGVLTALYHLAGGLSGSAPASVTPALELMARTISGFLA